MPCKLFGLNNEYIEKLSLKHHHRLSYHTRMQELDCFYQESKYKHSKLQILLKARLLMNIFESMYHISVHICQIAFNNQIRIANNILCLIILHNV